MAFDSCNPPDPNVSHLHRGHLTQVSPRQGCSWQSPVYGPEQKQLMPTNDVGGYAEPNLIDISVQCLNGEGCALKLSGCCTGLELYRMVLKQLPRKKGGQLTLQHLDSPLIWHKSLQEQGIVGKAATLSCTYVPSDLYAAWRAIRGLPVPQGELAVGGVTRIVGAATLESLSRLPQSLEHLTFSNDFSQRLD